MREHRDPLQPFWLATCALNIDDTIDLGFEASETFDTEAEAIEYLREQYREHRAEGYIYACYPSVALVRPPAKLRRLKASQTRPASDGEATKREAQTRPNPKATP